MEPKATMQLVGAAYTAPLDTAVSYGADYSWHGGAEIYRAVR